MTIQGLREQEEICVKKYTKYSTQAKDQVLKDLFKKLQGIEERHYSTLSKILEGTVPDCDCNDSKGEEYSPCATYTKEDNTEDKKADCFLATDAIGTEKMVSSEYNTDIFAFGNADVRKALADIQVEEQNHAQMLNKYKMANGM